jgi:hypothetical protein
LAKATDFSTFLNAPQTQARVVQTPYASYVTEGSLFFRLERLADDLKPLWKHLGFELSISVVNQSARARDWRPFYTDADAALVARLCAVDIARSDYRFDPD